MKVLSILLEVTIYSAVLFGVIWLFRILLKKHLSPAMLYMVWFLLIARLMMPVTITSGFSFFIVSPQNTAAQTETANITELLEGLDQTIVFNQNELQAEPGSLEDSETPQEPAGRNTSAGTPAASASDIQLNITWETALVLLWLAGMAAMLIQMGVSALRLKKRLKNALPVPHEWQRIIDELKTGLGLKRNVRVVMIREFPSPALTAGINPVVVLPEEMLNKSGEPIRFALLHELTHIRRKDHIVSLLLLLLRAVYWFNPVVWLMEKQMRLDMEKACDSRLVRPMNTADKKRYAGTVLSMYAHRQVRHVLGMALGQTKKTAEQRLRGVFMRGRSSKKGRLAAILLAGAMLVACFTTACQPTPEKEIVVGKDQNEMISAAAQTPETESETLADQVAAPGAYTVDVSAADGKLAIFADGADVVVPDAETMPIIRVNAADFEQETVDKLIEVFFKEQTIYEVEYAPETKDDIMEQIVYTKRLKESEEYSSEGDQQQLDEEIARLQARYETAPETGEDIVTESAGQLKQEERVNRDTGEHISYYMALSVTTNYEDYSRARTLWVQNNSLDMQETYYYDSNGCYPLRRNAMLGYENRGDAYDSNFAQKPPVAVDEDTVIDDPDVLEKLKTTPAEAKALVEEMLKEAGIDNMTVVAMYLEDDENLGNFDGLVSPAEHYAYKLYLCRTVNGVPVAYIRGSSMAGDSEETIAKAIEDGDTEAAESLKNDSWFSGEWDYETIDVMVDDTGIMSFDWWSPLEIGETVVENSTLMPFDDIAQKFEKQMKIEYESRVGGDRFNSITFTVDRVSLEFQRIAEQNSIENGLLVPVWNFYGTCSVIDSEGVDHGDAFLSGDGVYNWPILTINAVDGSIIDITQGY